MYLCFCETVKHITGFTNEVMTVSENTKYKFTIKLDKSIQTNFDKL